MNKAITKKTLFSIVIPLALAGCGDPLAGQWEAEDDSDVDLFVEADGSRYRGDGHIYVCDSDECFLCPFDFEARENGDRRWTIEGDFTRECSGAGSFDGIDCELNDAGDELDCRVGSSHIRYQKLD